LPSKQHPSAFKNSFINRPLKISLCKADLVQDPARKKLPKNNKKAPEGLFYYFYFFTFFHFYF